MTPKFDFPPVEFFEKGEFSSITADYVEALQE
jgi:hypothetical protein